MDRWIVSQTSEEHYLVPVLMGLMERVRDSNKKVLLHVSCDMIYHGITSKARFGRAAPEHGGTVVGGWVGG